MDPEVERLGRIAAEKQNALIKAVYAYVAGAKRKPGDRDVYDGHTELSDALVTARKECNEATRALHEAALRAAGIPESDPIWEWVRKAW